MPCSIYSARHLLYTIKKGSIHTKVEMPPMGRNCFKTFSYHKDSIVLYCVLFLISNSKLF